MAGVSPAWTVSPESVDSPAATALWRAYYTEVSDRWYLKETGRPTEPGELERGIAEETGESLRGPDGVLLVARFGGEALGTAGVRRLDATTCELKRVFLLPSARGKGGGTVLMDAAEEAARAFGGRRLVLDTRLDLIEARKLYVKRGFAEIPAYNSGAYQEIWYGKELGPAPYGR
ncbi:GNAT family N-acetyltransferase [Streptomyces sp. TRM66268-LWL]|uniref:GNAT family N-acetyltransferase n=1 Tax=Streptomyces polyasparticus TaxID=2767826 RepID=A0ABR7SDI0_9ACTN|nr:GNAT family N-acetyltransferase [Streptomyces polyasparticus]MBC9712541.1 GNAT family N-acetyltransferase [Streptomyces polyasparticus]